MRKRPMPKFTKPPAELVSFFEQTIYATPGVEARRMFGYPAGFASGHMFGACSRITSLEGETRLNQFTLPSAQGLALRMFLRIPRCMLLVSRALLRSALTSSYIEMSVVPSSRACSTYDPHRCWRWLVPPTF
jgi:hypothetical protein